MLSTNLFSDWLRGLACDVIIPPRDVIMLVEGPPEEKHCTLLSGKNINQPTKNVVNSLPNPT